MFDSDTVFVIGAGASKEAGLPIGDELTEKIANLVNIHSQFNQVKRGDALIYDALLRLSRDDIAWQANRFLASGREIAEAMELALSIDTFLETHASNPEFVLLGKLGIVRAISLEESKSLLGPSQDRSRAFRMKSLTDKWYYSLARQLFVGVPVEKPELAFENVSFIVFNYDRCLQVFLMRALQVYFRLSANDAARILANVRFLHPYGSLGSIFEGNDHVPFAPESLDLIAASKRIKTFSESAESDVAETAKTWIQTAQTLVFLGFGFHEQNMKLLQPHETQSSDDPSFFGTKAYATTFELSESDAGVVEDQIADLKTGSPYGASVRWIHTSNGTCNQLFQSYWRSLTQ